MFDSVAMAPPDGEFIHGQQDDLRQVRIAQRRLKVGLVDGLHRVPTQALEFSYVLDGQDLAQPGHALG